ncbi:MAG TPA: hypothetical protein VLE89_01095, partial [Chlamydiales bacterium]|nr:hypothetical protein [Chlamydiales bacterium]
MPWIPHRDPIEPFLSGDTFRAHCDYAYDEISKSFNPEEMRPRSTLFINGDLLGEFVQQIHPRIQVPYILIVHNTDHAIPGRYAFLLDDPHLIAFFTQNKDDTEHPKLHPLPIGIENRHWKPMNRELLQETKAKNLEKTHLLYCNFNKDTFPSERSQVLSLFARTPFTYTARRKSYPDFITDLAASKFVLSPRGNGLDTHRLWEALYAGSYPIVKTSSLDPLYENLPIVIVKDWREVTQEFLNRKYEEL